MKIRHVVGTTLVATLISVPLISTAATSKNSANQQLASFRQKLTKDQEILHALGRLTFGPRPGDVEQVKKIGLKKWIDQQLNPESIPENPALEAKLAPLESLRMSNQQIAENYPPPQLVVAVAAGRAPLPQDPEKRATLERLAARY